MPQAIATLVVSALKIGGIAGAIAKAVITVGLSLGLNAAAQAIFGSGRQKPSDGQQIIRVSVGSRIRHYGRVRVAGQLTFYESRNGTLYSLITTGHGLIAQIVDYQLNGKGVTVNGSGLVTDSKFRGAVSIFHRLGSATQTAYSELTAAISEWTSNHRQRGCSSVLVVCRGIKPEHFSEVYEGNREPQATVTIDSSLVYDPRKDSTAIVGYDKDGDPVLGSGSHRLNNTATWEFSDNWALTFADYLGNPDGYGVGYDQINWTNIAQEADICDEDVTTVDERVIPRWRAAGSYKLADDERRTVVKEFLKAGDGFMWQDAEGKANIRCGRWIEPTLTIPAKHVLGCSASLGTDATRRANEVRVIYMEPRFGFTETEAAPLVDEAARLALGRGEVSRFDCFFCPDHNQAQRIGKRMLRRLGERWTMTLTVNLFGLNAIGERFIRVTIPELGIDNLAFELTSLRLDLGRLTVTLGLLEAEEADFSFDATQEEGAPAGDIPSTSVAIVIEEVEGFALSAVQVTLGGSNGVAIKATWNAAIRVGLLTQVQYRATDSTEWLEMTVSQDERIATSGIVSSGVAYEVRARHITVAGRPSDWSATETITPSAAVFYDTGGNRLLSPEDFSSTWTGDNSGSGSSNPVVTANYGQAPNGTFTADRLQFTRGASGFSRLQQSATVTNGVRYKFAVWLKAASAGASISLRLDGNAGGTLNLTTGWQRYEMEADATSTGMDAQLILWSSISGSPTTADVQAWGAQLIPA